MQIIWSLYIFKNLCSINCNTILIDEEFLIYICLFIFFVFIIYRGKNFGLKEIFKYIKSIFWYFFSLVFGLSLSYSNKYNKLFFNGVSKDYIENYKTEVKFYNFLYKLDSIENFRKTSLGSYLFKLFIRYSSAFLVFIVLFNNNVVTK